MTISYVKLKKLAFFCLLDFIIHRGIPFREFIFVKRLQLYYIMLYSLLQYFFSPHIPKQKA